MKAGMHCIYIYRDIYIYIYVYVLYADGVDAGCQTTSGACVEDQLPYSTSFAALLASC